MEGKIFNQIRAIVEGSEKVYTMIEFFNEKFATEEFEADFVIFEHDRSIYSVVVDTDGNGSVTIDGEKAFKLSAQTTKEWLKEATAVFTDRYEQKIEEAKEEMRFQNWLEYQEALA